MAKYIFDFDDVLFFNTAKFKKYMYECFQDVGASYETVRKYYSIEKEKGWVLGNLVSSVLQGENIASAKPSELTEKIMVRCKEFLNFELVDRVKQLKVSDCFMVTHGVTRYQLDKVNRTGIGPYFTEIFVVQDTKKGPVEMLCKRFRDEVVVFVDDKEKRFADLDFEKHPNLRKILYKGPENIQEIFNP